MKKLVVMLKLVQLNIKAMMENLPHYLSQMSKNTFIIDTLEIQTSVTDNFELFIYEKPDPGESIDPFSISMKEKIQLLVNELLEMGVELDYDQKDI